MVVPPQSNQNLHDSKTSLDEEVLILLLLCKQRSRRDSVEAVLVWLNRISICGLASQSLFLSRCRNDDVGL